MTRTPTIITTQLLNGRMTCMRVGVFAVRAYAAVKRGNALTASGARVLHWYMC